MRSRVPQGLVLGPLLFLIMMGDINKKVPQSKVSSFADDIRINRAITTLDDAKTLQADLNKLTNWAVDNNMSFNKDKFELIRYGESAHLKTSPYQVEGHEIAEKSSLRDLGVLVSNDFSPTEHIDNITRMAGRTT